MSALLHSTRDWDLEWCGERPMTGERASLEREILLLHQSIAAAEAALQVQGISAKDRTWVTQQLGLRQLQLGRLAARLDALPPLRDTSGRKNRRKPMARPALNSGEKAVDNLGRTSMAMPRTLPKRASALSGD